MKNVLMLTYMYYPANHIASHRPGKMARYLPEFGWNPVVVCPQWTESNSPYFDPRLQGQFESNATVHAIPYHFKPGSDLSSKLARAAASMANPRILGVRILRRFNTALEKNPPEFYYGAIRFLRQYLRCNRIDCIWATEAVSHAIASQIHNEFHIPWIADFRDLFDQKGFTENAPGKAYLKRIEPRLLRTCSMLVTVSEPLKEILRGRHSQPVHVVENGFDHADYADGDAPAAEASPVFRIVYTGKIIYPLQDPSPLLEATSRLVTTGTVDPKRINISFYGTEAEEVLLELKGRYAGLDDIVDVRPRIGHEEVIRIQRKAGILLLLALSTQKGILTGKVYEYLGARRPILCIPGDRDCVDALIAETNAGIVCRNAEEVAKTLAHWYDRWKTTGTVAYDGIDAEIMKHSRRERARVLAGLLDQCTGGSAGGEASATADALGHNPVCDLKTR